MLSPDIKEFIDNLLILYKTSPRNAIGCLTVPKKTQDRLIKALQEMNKSVALHVVNLSTQWHTIKAPALLVVTEEDFSADKTFAEALREKAAYFMNIN